MFTKFQRTSSKQSLQADMDDEEDCKVNLKNNNSNLNLNLINFKDPQIPYWGYSVKRQLAANCLSMGVCELAEGNRKCRS